MKASMKSTRLLLGLAAVLGLVSGLSLREARAQDPTAATVYLWKDSKGACPAICDNNDFACPCRVADIE